MDKNFKRTRTPNFTPEEKMQIVRVLSEKGQCIISKVTAHDAKSNKEKEQAWEIITRIHNSGRQIVRTSDTLKKLWAKLKTDAKKYKESRKVSVSGTGRGLAKHIDDRVMELVLNVIARHSTKISKIHDNDDAVVDMEEDGLTASGGASSIYDDFDVNVIDNFPEGKIIDKEENIEVIEINEVEEQKKPDKRRIVLNFPNERMESNKQQENTSNIIFAAERLRAEKEKFNLISLQIKQNKELHRARIENEKLKKMLLHALLKKVGDGNYSGILRGFLFD